jgi:predicted dehydrogenase
MLQYNSLNTPGYHMPLSTLNIALIGCGYVADFYMASLAYHPSLKLVGAFDKNTQRLKIFCNHYSIKIFSDIEEILSDSSIDIILNLTNPAAHYTINKRCLEAGKHVYCEKPLAMTYNEAATLARLSKEKNIHLSAAPCSMLSETAQSVLQALKENVIGTVQLVYANFDAGMNTKKTKPWLWQSPSGAFWPAKDEFEVGCTYEHAGYMLTWLAMFFGPAKTISSFAALQTPDKGIPVDTLSPDFTVGCIQYEKNILARVTCSLAAPLDRSLTIIGDKGTLYVKDIRDDACPIYIRDVPHSKIKNALQHRLNYYFNTFERYLNWLPGSWGNYWRISQVYPFKYQPKTRYAAKHKPVDFCRGLADLSQAIQEKRAVYLSADFSAHIVELTEALQYPERFDRSHTLISHFKMP